jgi:hypothetical protein
MRSAAWDVSLVAFGWLPFLAFVVGVLGIGRDWEPAGRGPDPVLARATLIALATTYVHRHYTFVLVYGDPQAFVARARAYVLAPLIVFGGTALAVRTHGEVAMQVPGLGRVSPWFALLIIVGAWNMWHTLMQRHGLHRVYGGKAGGGLEQRVHGGLDLRLLWSLAALTAVIVPMFRAETFVGVGNARRLIKTLDPIAHGPVGYSLLVAASAAVITFGARWLRAEWGAHVAPRRRVPRLVMWASTVALLSVFVVWGPIVGYLCFGMAHSLEYIAFVHHFGARKYSSPHGSVAAGLFGRPVIGTLILVGGLLGLFFALRDVSHTRTYLAYYTATSLLHFLYDGWIWKVRRPSVARPLGIVTPSSAVANE